MKDGLIDGLITDDNDAFTGCDKLNYVELIEGELHETVAALHLEEWRNDMNEEVDSINRILPNANAGYLDYDGAGLREVSYGSEKARAVRRWIRSVLRKIIHYQEVHQRILEAAATLKLLLPQDIVTNNVFRFIELPSHTFEVEEEVG